jgi:hypothetical protein
MTQYKPSRRKTKRIPPELRILEMLRIIASNQHVMLRALQKAKGSEAACKTCADFLERHKLHYADITEGHLGGEQVHTDDDEDVER